MQTYFFDIFDKKNLDVRNLLEQGLKLNPEGPAIKDILRILNEKQKN